LRNAAILWAMESETGGGSASKEKSKGLHALPPLAAGGDSAPKALNRKEVSLEAELVVGLSPCGMIMIVEAVEALQVFG